MSEEPKSKAAGPVRELSVVLPAYNEEANIERVVRQVAAYLEPTGLDYEILPVNDGSRDRTGEILDCAAARAAAGAPASSIRRTAATAPRCAPASTPRASATSSTWTATASSTSRTSTSCCRWPARTCIVTGFRIERRDPLMRRLNAKLFGGWLVRVMLGVYVQGPQLRLQAHPEESLRAPSQLESTGALINAELYGRAIRAGFGIREVGVHHYPREAGVQTGAHLSVILRAFYDLFRLRQKIISTQPKKIHHEVG